MLLPNTTKPPTIMSPTDTTSPRNRGSWFLLQRYPHMNLWQKHLPCGEGIEKEGGGGGNWEEGAPESVEDVGQPASFCVNQAQGGGSSPQGFV